MNHAPRRSRPPRRLFGVLLAGLLLSCQTGPADPGGGSGSPPTALHPVGHGRPTGSASQAVPAVSPAGGQPSPEEPPPRSLLDVGPPTETLSFVTGLKGHTEPCGCAAGLDVGGLDRLVGSVRAARERQPAWLVVDGGNMLFEPAELEPHEVEQERAKSEVIVFAQRRLGTVATVTGVTDLALGLDFYLERMREAGIDVLAANLTRADGRPFAAPSGLYPLGELQVGVIGAADPSLFQGRSEVIASEPADAVAAAAEELEAEGADPVVLVFQGDRAATERLLVELAERGASAPIDFAVAAFDPEETGAVSEVGGVPLLQALDQSRYLGVLELYPGEAGAGEYRNARRVDRSRMEQIDRRLDYLRGQLDLLTATDLETDEQPSIDTQAAGSEPPIVGRMRQEVDDLESERAQLERAAVVVPEEGGAFLYRAVALQPGYPSDPEVRARMVAFNESLAALNAARTEPLPLGPGDVAYVGASVCMGCHQPAYAQWQSTQHAHAMDSLEARAKAFDVSCVGCHVTGFREPGGSVTGNHNGLSEVQCESCHGPGGRHIQDTERGTLRLTPPAICERCHNPAHSPAFDYQTYLPRVLGPGHGE